MSPLQKLFLTTKDTKFTKEIQKLKTLCSGVIYGGQDIDRDKAMNAVGK